MAAAPSKRLPEPEAHIAAIFVHAGAGFHSVQNEQIHLRACADAARVAMKSLRAGSSAVDAVELAVKALEDNEVTNAGYGSNLTAQGKVEGDATIVDHFGRCGAVGAIPHVKNPIHVARAVYERSLTPMALGRIPPNLLVADGATDFALEHSMDVLPNEYLVSRGARERFDKWKRDIAAAETSLSPSDSTGAESTNSFARPIPHTPQSLGGGLSQAPHIPLLAPLANESQPFSPSEQYEMPQDFPDPSLSVTASPMGNQVTDAYGHVIRHADSTLEAPYTNLVSSHHNLHARPAYQGHGLSLPTPGWSPDFIGISPGIASGGLSHTSLGNTTSAHAARESHFSDEHADVKAARASANGCSNAESLDEDLISDTVGAIAVDSQGRIAAASSSGGIGMKHKGRVGPAALVGIGTAVIPVQEGDIDCTTVACVASGTGEHMATASAADSCARRLYSSSKLGPKGVSLPCTEDEAMMSFIRRDFMGHPGVRNAPTGGAIGVMAVKKDSSGMWLYFGHNTDSFALASMHFGDSEPQTVMSRSSKSGRVTTGARSMRHGYSSPSGSSSAKARRRKKARQEGGDAAEV